MPESNEIVSLQALRIGYQGKHGEQKAVAGPITAQLSAGELTCLLGPNGIGKSTLLQTLCAFLPKLGGSVLLNGKEVDRYSDKELSKNIGIVLTGKPEVQNMTVAELVGLGRSPYTGFWGMLSEHDKNIVDEALQLVGISHLDGRMVRTLSDGERQKAMIAKALAQQTPVIYMDEPTAFLDFPSKVEMMQLLRRLCKETRKTIFLSTHDLELTLQLADRLWLMLPDGMHIGTPRELAAQGFLARFVEREGIAFDTDEMRVLIRS